MPPLSEERRLAYGRALYLIQRPEPWRTYAISLLTGVRESIVSKLRNRDVYGRGLHVEPVPFDPWTSPAMTPALRVQLAREGIFPPGEEPS